MITYICRNKDIKTGEDLPCTNTVCKTSICPSCGQRADAGSQIYWCKSCKTPIYEEVCPICNKKGKKLATDLRPVFPEERLLLELILGTPYAFLEKKDMEKELYLQEMEDIFCDAQTEKIIRSNRLSVIMENMQKWYRSLPQYTRVSERYPQEMLYVVRNFRRLLKQTELNPREFLFEQLPNAMDSSKNHMTGLLVREMKRSMDTHFENAIEDTAKEIKKIFGAKESDSLKACLQDWYGRQQNRSKRYVLNKKIKSFMEYVGELNTNDEREIVAVLSKRLEDIYIEDWNDRLQEKFLRDITKIRQKTEAAKEDAGLENGQKEIFLKTADGAEIHKYYDADVKDSTSEFLKNMIEEALDNFGDSLETNQKVAVLAEALEKLLQ